MNKFLLLFMGVSLLLVPSFGSDLTEEDISIWGSPATAGVNVWVQTTKPIPVYNLTIALINPPEGVILRDNSTKIIPYVPATGFETVTFHATLTTATLTREDFEDSLQLISWEDSMEPVNAFFTVDGVPVEGAFETEQEEVIITGKTEGTELCQYFKTIPGEESNEKWDEEEICNTKIIVNGVGQPYSEETAESVYASEDGSFEIAYTLRSPGLNKLNVTAVDPEKNSESIELEVTYTGSSLVVTPSFDLVHILVAVFAVVVILVVLLVFVLIILKMRNFRQERKPLTTTAKVKKKIKESEEWTEDIKQAMEEPVKKEVKKKPEPVKKEETAKKPEPVEEKEEVQTAKKEPAYKKFKEGSLDYLKGQREELKETIASLEKKKKLSTKEKEELTRAKEEFDTVESKLIKNDDFLLELEERAFKALVDAKEGKSSKQIKKELVDEGYSKAEIKKIREFFIKGKG